MKLEVLRYFLEVGQEGSIRKASERMNITPSALSRHIATLEHMVGAELFERKSKGMTLTDEGRILTKYAMRTVSGVDMVRSAVEEIRGLRSGVVKVAAIEIVASSLLFPAIHEFRSRFPGVTFQVEIITKENDDTVHALFKGQADIGIMYKLNPVAEIDYQSEFETPFAVIAAPDHPLAARSEVSLKDLAGVPIATLGRHNATRRLLERTLAAQGYELDYMLRVNSIEMSKEFAQTGMGVTILPSLAVRLEVARGTLKAIPLSDWALQRVRCGICTHEGQPLSCTAASFLELLKQRATTH
ncbi:MAG TPA: LysR family transcriptional regulator [Ramlibacter sp.]|nr:LysR family transcriptional regulator [Ramlibacter sp.]